MLPGNVLTTGVDSILGTGNDTITATTNTLSTDDTIDGGPGANTLDLLGGGSFDLALPATLKNLQTVTAQEGEGATAQTVTLRAGLDLTVNVTPDSDAGDTAPGSTILGAANHDLIVAGTGTDNVTLGVGETLDATGGTDLVTVTAATIGDIIIGSAGHNAVRRRNRSRLLRRHDRGRRPGGRADLRDFAYSSATILSVSAGTGVAAVSLSQGGSVAQLTLLGSYTSAGRHLGQDSGAGTSLTFT